jgi:preprotein translocase subunit SecF
MKRVIQFSKARYYFFAFSVLLVLIGVVGYIVNHGFNLGVDFKAGISLQFQVAPASFTVQYSGPDKAEISIPAGEEALTSAGNIIISVVSAKDGTRKDFPFRYADYHAVRDLTAAIGTVPGVTVRPVGDMNAVPTTLLPLTRPQDMAAKPVYINLAPGPGRGVTTDMAQMRATLAPLGQVELQAVGSAANQEFIARLEAKSEDPAFQTTTENALRQVLEQKYGTGQVIMKSVDFIGRRVAQSLGTQAIWLVLIAVVLIMIYMMFRFRPAIYAVAAVIAIMHDALVMLSFDAVFRVEIDSATIAAILTILGYSINDTIVIFDRVRENNKLMRGTPLRSILDTSVTQTLSRTFITSGATLLTVIALYVLTSGSLKNFALNMIVGIVEGTYSTFIASFIVLEWTRTRERRTRKREMTKYGIAGRPELVEETVAVGAATAAKMETEAEGADEEGADEGDEETAPLAPGQLAPAPAAAVAGEGASAGLQPQPAGADGAARPGLQPFMGHSGSRKNKKHRRRHH